MSPILLFLYFCAVSAGLIVVAVPLVALSFCVIALIGASRRAAAEFAREEPKKIEEPRA